MTIDCNPPIPFIRKSEVSHYPATIPWKHWQLRSLITSPSPNIVYYPSSNNIFMINTADRRRELVANLAFEPRCIGAKYGWLCAGGHEGQVAVMHVEEVERQWKWEARIRKREMEGQSSTPPYTTEEEQDEYMNTLASLESTNNRVEIAEFGEQITNSITLHKFEGGRRDGSDVVLAVLTNNDMTVRIIDLANKLRKVHELKLEFATNHASISPDGKWLVVVGDTSRVHFLKLNLNLNSREPIGKPLIFLTGTDSHMYTAFSSSSTQCAVACQDGTITIFDVNKLEKGQGAIVKKIQSERHGQPCGAIRSVHFSPAPWDLLVWAEHTGRVSLADTRSDYEWQETIEVLLKDEAVVRKELAGPTEEEFARRLNGTHGPVNARIRNHPRAPDGSSPVTRASAPEYDPGWDDDNLDTDTSPYAYRPSQHTMRPNIGAVAMFPTLEATASNGLTPRQQQVLPQIFSTENSILLLNPMSPLHQATRYFRNDNPHIHFTPSALRQHLQRPSSLRTGIPPPAPSAPHSATVSRQPSRRDMRPSAQADRQTDGPELSNRAPLSVNPDFDRLISGETTRRRIIGSGAETTASSSNRRRLHLDSRGEYEGRQHSNRRYDTGEGELDVNGCTFSNDGSKLYVATNQGLIEYKVNTQGRMFFPAVAFR